MVLWTVGYKSPAPTDFWSSGESPGKLNLASKVGDRFEKRDVLGGSMSETPVIIDTDGGLGSCGLRANTDISWSRGLN